ncbi:probable disease resistance protein At5g66900 [Rutidosis leptorrhynchoides]|uniref:probable disease resistance protein At5g66900 n=1 Tax=Rutidosis leptorrhynchoides TaxID=125765 RepID=UPI003A99FF45
MKCEHIKWNFYKILTHESKLKKLNESLVRFCQTDVQLMIFRGVSDLQTRMMNCDTDSSGWLCGVPLPQGDVIGFDNHLMALKSMVLKDSVNDNDCSVVVVSAGGGYGKTTLVKKLCNDPQIIGKCSKNIRLVTISETPNLKNVIEDLLTKKQDHFVNDEDAVNRWGSFLRAEKPNLLLVLDDVWSEDIVKKFMFKLRGYKILVTSRTEFKAFNNIYQLKLLNREDAIKLFRYSSLSEPGSTRSSDIPDDLIEKLVDCCKNHPLTLTVVGGVVKGKSMPFWLDMLKKLSEEKQSVISIDDQLFHCLKRSLNVFDEDSVIRQCFLDLGLFPEDQKIAATALMDMWVHLYKHDDEGLKTIKQLLELSYKNLFNLSPIRDDSSMVANWCEEKTVRQHDVMRQLAIHLSSQGPEEHRKRLIINVNGEDLPPLLDAINAQILSISTGERFSMNWNDMQASKVEVFVLNFMSEKYVLPRFMKYIEKFKVLIITSYGYYFSELENFPPPQYLSSLTRIRLDHVSISSISTQLLELVNLQKLSLIMCKIGNSFNEFTDGIPQKLPNLLEMDIDEGISYARETY